jgi:hypothetical protein
VQAQQFGPARVVVLLQVVRENELPRFFEKVGHDPGAGRRAWSLFLTRIWSGPPSVPPGRARSIRVADDSPSNEAALNWRKLAGFKNPTVRAVRELRTRKPHDRQDRKNVVTLVTVVTAPVFLRSFQRLGVTTR